MEVVLVDCILEDGMMFIVQSATHWWTWYEVFINPFGHTTCDCMDAQCRQKQPHFVDMLNGTNHHACKHMIAVAKEVQKCLIESH